MNSTATSGSREPAKRSGVTLRSCVGDTRDKGRLGSDDDKLDVVVEGVGTHDITAGRVECDDRHDGRDTGIAGRAPQFGQQR